MQYMYFDLVWNIVNSNAAFPFFLPNPHKTIKVVKIWMFCFFIYILKLLLNIMCKSMLWLKD